MKIKTAPPKELLIDTLTEYFFWLVTDAQCTADTVHEKEKLAILNIFLQSNK